MTDSNPHVHFFDLTLGQLLNPGSRPHTAASKAASKVFDTVELLEMILAYFSVVEICGLQRTCKAFHETTLGSPKIQKAMCFSNKTDKPELAALLGECAFRPSSISENGPDSLIVLKYSHLKSVTLGFTLHASTAPSLWKRRIISLKDHPEASWRQMFAVTKVMSLQIETKRWHEEFKVYYDDCKLGRLMELLDDGYSKYHEGLLERRVENRRRFDELGVTGLRKTEMVGQSRPLPSLASLRM